jgi:hypothetical protein
MSTIIQSRRGFITGLVLLVAAPAIVRVASIMPVKVMPAELTVYGESPGMAAIRMIEELAAIHERIQRAFFMDLAAFGNAAIEFGHDGAVRHIPISEWGQ